jgi:hypothetical protein
MFLNQIMGNDLNFPLYTRLQSHLDITSRLGGKNPCSLYRNSLYQKMHVKVWEKIFTKLFERLKNKGTRKIILSKTKNSK